MVSLGGGHGLFALLTALRQLDVDRTAVVTVADDGGSSGRLRRDVAGVLPPGDLRMALTALAASNGDQNLMARTFQHRFSGQGALSGHPVGNILLVGLSQVLRDPVAALDVAARLLGAEGRVLPMACQPLDIVADVTGLDEDPSALRQIRGQVAVASTPGAVRSVRISPESVPACPQAVNAIHHADVVTLGPGSWFTSVLPHLMVPELAEAIIHTPARRVLILNLAPQAGETEGFSPERHLEVLVEHAPDLRLDTVIADRRSVPLPQRLRTAAGAVGAELVLADVADENSPHHNPAALATTLADVLREMV